ncbi:hypothetical protein [Peribacillus asahii]|uniref:hypothetical protein n=1 Tax=Peribacillus asahii TaxID=228899 RepID=UPI003810E5B4
MSEEDIQDLFAYAGIDYTDYKLKRMKKLLADDKTDLIHVLEDSALEVIYSIIVENWKSKNEIKY